MRTPKSRRTLAIAGALGAIAMGVAACGGSDSSSSSSSGSSSSSTSSSGGK
ncbi:MAG: hypothetical protein QOD73_2582, partial [Solirubrobacteraceae bacterium]|nr:hypothetical protein [Solirubrobacteraceae bacterium]